MSSAIATLDQHKVAIHTSRGGGSIRWGGGGAVRHSFNHLSAPACLLYHAHHGSDFNKCRQSQTIRSRSRKALPGVLLNDMLFDGTAQAGVDRKAGSSRLAFWVWAPGQPGGGGGQGGGLAFRVRRSLSIKRWVTPRSSLPSWHSRSPRSRFTADLASSTISGSTAGRRRDIRDA